mgnify:CR=1 FL=1|tara:strand:- start:22 stop:510 length:489 start_codon:yes stop_codon:yes gene_type:complete
MNAPVKIAAQDWQPSSPTVRRITADDFDEIVDWAKQSYDDFDVESGLMWLAWAVAHPDKVISLRGNDTWAAATLETAFWAPSRIRAMMLLWCSNHANKKRSVREPLVVMRELVNWAEASGAKSFWIQGIAGTDLAPLARFLKAREAGEIYVIPLGGVDYIYG